MIMTARKKLKPQLMLDDLEGQYSAFDVVGLQTISEENEMEPKEKNGWFAGFLRLFRPMCFCHD